MKLAKSHKSDSGILVPHKPLHPVTKVYSTTTTPAPVTFRTTTAYPIVSTTIVSPSPFHIRKSPSVFIRPNAEPIHHNFVTPTYETSTVVPSTLKFIPSNELDHHSDHLRPSPPSVYYQPPFESREVKDESDLPPLVLFPSSTRSPNRHEAHLPPIALFPSSTPKPFDDSNVIPLPSTIASITVKDLDNELLPPREYPNYKVIPITASTPRTPTVTQSYRPNIRNQNVVIESSTPKTLIEYSRNNIDSAQNYQYYKQGVQSNQNNGKQFPYYDGISSTNNGFRYFLPKMYHEEQDSGESKDGSFGYLDPFGIRRVVYYSAGNNGFIHRKNNRYVGFNAPPYDPEPNN